MTRPSTGKHVARKRYGQHFLIDDAVIERIVSLIAPAAGEHVIEIGPGLGALTDRLAASGARITAVEIDRDLAAELSARYRDNQTVTIVNADVLKHPLPLAPPAADARGAKIVGNLPYNISTPLLMKLLHQSSGISAMTFMVQLEVAERLAARPCTKAYGRLSIMAQWRARVTRQLVVAAESFDPPPKVLSAVIQLHPLDISANESVTENLGRIVRAAFSARRKTLANALRGVASPEEISCCNIDPALRPEALSVDDYLRLATAVEQRARRA